MHIHHLYADENGVSHFKDIEVELNATQDGGATSGFIALKGLQFRRTPENQDRDWHCAPRRQYVVHLSGGVAAVTASDGETRHIKPGEIVLVEDTFGKGHMSRALDGLSRESIFLHL